MGIFDRAGLPRDDYRSLSAALGAKPSVLAWGRGEQGLAVGLPDRLAYQGPDGWTFVGWHDILTGGWEGMQRRLRWRLTDGTDTEVTLDDPGSLPELFRERVDSTIVVRRRLEFPGGKAALIVARRQLDDPGAPLAWSLTPHGRLTDAQDDQALAELGRLRFEYDIG